MKESVGTCACINYGSFIEFAVFINRLRHPGIEVKVVNPEILCLLCQNVREMALKDVSLASLITYVKGIREDLVGSMITSKASSGMSLRSGEESFNFVVFVLPIGTGSITGNVESEDVVSS